jgi:hypothetical protein
MNNIEYVSGELFSKLADVSIYDRMYLIKFPNIKNNCNKIIYNNEPINNEVVNLISNSKIFFVKTDHLVFFITKILQFIRKEFILITHNSDLKSGTYKQIIDNNYLIKWYGQNMTPIFNSSKTIGIPIGLQNSQWDGHDYNIIKKYKNNKKENLLYFNFSLDTNPLRHQINKILLNNGFIKNTKKEWKQYIEELSSYIFCISPEGNGVDCHRIWECLYVGCIPIVKKDDILYKYFNDLPILWIDDFTCINKQFLEEQYKLFKSNTYNLEKITMKYWYLIIRRN